MAEWIGEVRINPEVADKLRTKHNLTPALVRNAIAAGAATSLTWHTDPVYGRRIIANGAADGVRIKAYLRPLDRNDGLWECMTAWRIDG